MDEVLEDEVDVNAFAEGAVVTGAAAVHAPDAWCPTAGLLGAL